MKIAEKKFVTIDFTLKDEEGNVIESTQGNEPLSYIHGTGMLIPGLEEELIGKQPGDSVQVTLPPEKGYGAVNPEMIFDVPRSEMGGITELSKGMQLQAQTPDGIRIFTVSDIKEDSVTVDGNHPMAGQALNFNVTVSDVRDATEEELNPPHSCGCGGNGHGHEHGKEECCGGQGHGGGGSCGCSN